MEAVLAERLPYCRDRRERPGVRCLAHIAVGKRVGEDWLAMHTASHKPGFASKMLRFQEPGYAARRPCGSGGSACAVYVC